MAVNGFREWIETRFYIGKLKQESNVELYRGQRRFLDSSRKQDRISIFPPRSHAPTWECVGGLLLG